MLPLLSMSTPGRNPPAIGFHQPRYFLQHQLELELARIEQRYSISGDGDDSDGDDSDAECHLAKASLMQQLIDIQEANDKLKKKITVLSSLKQVENPTQSVPDTAHGESSVRHNAVPSTTTPMTQSTTPANEQLQKLQALLDESYLEKERLENVVREVALGDIQTMTWANVLLMRQHQNKENEKGLSQIRLDIMRECMKDYVAFYNGFNRNPQVGATLAEIKANLSISLQESISSLPGQVGDPDSDIQKVIDALTWVVTGGLTSVTGVKNETQLRYIALLFGAGPTPSSGSVLELFEEATFDWKWVQTEATVDAIKRFIDADSLGKLTDNASNGSLDERTYGLRKKREADAQSEITAATNKAAGGTPQAFIDRKKMIDLNSDIVNVSKAYYEMLYAYIDYGKEMHPGPDSRVVRRNAIQDAVHADFGHDPWVVAFLVDLEYLSKKTNTSPVGVDKVLPTLLTGHQIPIHDESLWTTVLAPNSRTALSGTNFKEEYIRISLHNLTFALEGNNEGVIKAPVFKQLLEKLLQSIKPNPKLLHHPKNQRRRLLV